MTTPYRQIRAQMRTCNDIPTASYCCNDVPSKTSPCSIAHAAICLCSWSDVPNQQRCPNRLRDRSDEKGVPKLMYSCSDVPTTTRYTDVQTSLSPRSSVHLMTYSCSNVPAPLYSWSYVLTAIYKRLMMIILPFLVTC